ncbi:Protein kinase domain,Protein kinase-like domain,Serine/threonine-protein kinase, active site,AGC- [Cinara cedri]|uniref:Protein kinase domain,Protein kinase-like domain,Serine/threonine-protein kinase, active site,AGC n=1 Tax=Cinara cedri TaxID=506608 RepID=A0A5E4NNR3_9HEMI|nr:Protein kinase domain,Protein kinase-like domain,Serine/threonine-protein kinase, active site,AGC- [Cinara cedri]
MGHSISQQKKSNEDDLRNLSDSQISSCELTEYWNGKKQDFHHSYIVNKKPLTMVAQATDFRLSTWLDKGAFGSVALTTHNQTGVTYATKVIAKKKIIKKELVERVYNEKRILESIDFPFVIRLEYFYQDNDFIYFVMPFACGGNFYTHIERHGPMNEDVARFYTGEILLALEYLHRLNLVHRDIKSENILFDSQGHAQLADFGFCKHITGRTYTFCGTPEYIAPEIILRQGYGKSVDYWAFGVFLYELVAGRSPFVHHDMERLFRCIVKGKYVCPLGFSGDLMNLLRNLLRVDVTKRYGNLSNGIRDIKKHRWFQPTGWDWCALFDKQIMPPYVPTIQNDKDTSNFNKLNEKLLLPTSNNLYLDEFKHF